MALAKKRMECFIHGDMVVGGCSHCEEAIMQNIHRNTIGHAAHLPSTTQVVGVTEDARCYVHGTDYVNGCTLCHEAFTKTDLAEQETRMHATYAGYVPQSLTFIEQYFLGLAVEECGESAQWAGKALRFGIDTLGPKGMTARQGLHIELGDVIAAIRYGVRRGVLDIQKIEAFAQAKLEHLLDEESKDNLGRRLAP